jgi:type VI secretion system secreted protein Hcp
MAAADYFLKIDSIDGESQDSKHKNEIEISSFSWSGHLGSSGSKSTGAGSGMGKVTAGTLDFHTSLAKDTPKLFAALCGGTHLKTAVLTARKSGDGQGDYSKWTLTEVTVSSLSIGGGAGSVPSISFSLSFSKFEWEYKAQDAKGNFSVASSAGYDFAKNLKV